MKEGPLLAVIIKHRVCPRREFLLVGQLKTLFAWFARAVLRLTLHLDEYQLVASETELNWVDKKSIHFIDLRRLLDFLSPDLFFGSY